MTASDRSQGSSEGLTSAQLRAIAALLDGAGQDGVATAARRTQRTVRRWLQNAAFQAELATRSRQILSEATLILQQRAVDAATSLGGMASGVLPASSARVGACRAVLELARSSAEIEELRDLAANLTDRLKIRQGGIQ